MQPDGRAPGPIEHLARLHAHGEWADQRVLSAIRGAPIAVPDAVRELAHIRGAQETWLSRIEGRPASLPVWPELTVDALGTVGATVDAALRRFFATLDPAALDGAIAYANSAGQSFATPLHDILLHLMMHGQYHRGKANAALRTAGATPAGVDYILWQRERV